MAFNYRDIRFKWMEERGFNLMKDQLQLNYIQDLWESPEELRGVFCESPAGTGKTVLAVLAGAYGVENGEYDKIIYIRGTDVVGDEIGFLPGMLEEKIAPFMTPLVDALDYVKAGTFESWLESGMVQATTATYLRGVTFRRAFVILDEVQNMTIGQLQTIYTRLTDDCKAVSIGSLRQVDNEKLKRYGGLTPFEVYMKHYETRASFHRLRVNYRGDWSRHADKVLMTVKDITGEPYDRSEFEDEAVYSK